MVASFRNALQCYAWRWARQASPRLFVDFFVLLGLLDFGRDDAVKERTTSAANEADDALGAEDHEQQRRGDEAAHAPRRRRRLEHDRQADQERERDKRLDQRELRIALLVVVSIVHRSGV